jgi:O-antigen/teichoic acid export membrane protein
MKRESSLVKNTILLSVGTFLPRLATFVTLPILTAYLTKAEYGTFDLITVLVTLYLPALTLQIQTAAFRFLVDQRDNQEEIRAIISNIYAFTIPASLFGLLLMWVFLPATGGIKLFICLYFAADILVSTSRQIARGLNRNIEYSISAAVASFGNMLLTAIFVWWLRMGLTGAVLALSVSSVTSMLVIVLRLKTYQYLDVRCVSRAKLRKLLGYSWPMVPNNMSMWVMRLSDRLVVTGFMGVAVNAVYAAANKIPGLLNVAQSAFTLAWQENAAIVSKDEDAGAYYSAMFRTMFNLMAGFLGLIICATPVLFVILIRGDYAEAYFQMPILFLAAFCYSMATFLGGIYVAYMKTKSVGITTAAAAACNLIVDLALIRWIGLYAASGSTLVSYLFLMIYRMIDVRKIVSLKYDFKNIAAVSLVLITECVLCYLQMPVTDLINLLLGVAAFIILNRSFLRALKVKTLQLLRRGK